MRTNTEIIYVDNQTQNNFFITLSVNSFPLVEKFSIFNNSSKRVNPTLSIQMSSKKKNRIGVGNNNNNL